MKGGKRIRDLKPYAQKKNPISVWAGALILYHRLHHDRLMLLEFTAAITCTRVLSPPARVWPGGSNFCYTHSVWRRSPWSTRLHPRGDSGRYGYSANYCDRGRRGGCGLPQMAVSEFSQAQIGFLPLSAGNRPRPWSTPEQLRLEVTQVWGYIWFLTFVNSDRVVLLQYVRKESEVSSSNPNFTSLYFSCDDLFSFKRAGNILE